MPLPEQLFFLFFPILIFITVIVIILILAKRNKTYKSSAYYQMTDIPYHIYCDKGRYGEYLTYQQLKPFEAVGARFLVNIYIPKRNGETTEIDVLMICTKGIFVFESKNYSGWIFGSEDEKYWCQTLPTGQGKARKIHFYNPIMQNRSHIKHLRAFLGTQIPIWSVIVFSDRCTLKSVHIKSHDIRIVNRHRVAPVVAEIYNQIPGILLNEQNIADIYSRLYPYTQVNASVKAQHIANIHRNFTSQVISEIMHTTPIESTNVQIQANAASTTDTYTSMYTVEGKDMIPTFSQSLESVATEAQNTQIPK